MQIAIIGAAGQVGTLLTAEALKQDYQVTAIVRHPENLASRSVKVIEKSIFDLTSEDLKSFDVVINAYKAPQGQESDHIKSTEHLIDIFQSLPKTRLIVDVGFLRCNFRRFRPLWIAGYTKLLSIERGFVWFYQGFFLHEPLYLPSSIITL